MLSVTTEDPFIFFCATSWANSAIRIIKSPSKFPLCKSRLSPRLRVKVCHESAIARVPVVIPINENSHPLSVLAVGCGHARTWRTTFDQIDGQQFRGGLPG
jgi:hypothetical protein